jgi:glucuronokinase
MLIIRKTAFARAGLIGNPSDGYHGKTLSISVRNFFARVTLYEWDQLEVVPSQEDKSRFRSIDELAQDVKLHGYYGGIRLVKATIKRFVEYCRTEGLKLHRSNFSVRYETDIPRQVGLAGSSAIIVATLRCLMEFYGIEIPLRLQPSLVLSVETQELGIAAGLQDRVIQVYEGAVFMDFSPDRMESISGYDCGRYERVELEHLPSLYVACAAEMSEPTEVIHNRLRARYEAGEPAVLQAMAKFAALAEEARQAIAAGDAGRLGQLVDANFDLRRSICRLPRGQVQMVEVARECGASAKFAGSGGAIIGTYPDEATYGRLCERLGEIGCRVFKPRIVQSGPKPGNA